ncbi:MAG: hypothetical protein AAFY35_16520 [Pseudomonadota bacterium]
MAVTIVGGLVLFALFAWNSLLCWGDAVDWGVRKAAPLVYPRASPERLEGVADSLALAPVMIVAGAFGYGLLALLHFALF